MGLSYAKSGVDVSKVKGIQEEIARQLEGTLSKEVLLGAGHYSGLIRLGGKVLALHTDGVGTKVLIAEELSKFDTVGIDAVAMNVNDIICVGARPLALVDYLAVQRPDEEMISQIMKGLSKGAKEAGCAVIGGETAIVPELIRGGSSGRGFDLSATVLGEVDEEKIITGKDIKVGDVIVGLESSGLHSNGYTLARRALANPGKVLLLELLKPTRIYVKPVLETLKNAKVHGLAHITGGAFSKLQRLSKSKGFLLDAMPQPPKIFEIIARQGNIQPREMYRTFNMGIGFCIVCPKSEVAQVISACAKHNVKAQRVGTIVKKPGVWLRHGKETIELS